MLTTIIKSAVLFFALIFPTAIYADIAPAPTLSSSALEMTYEKVFISLYADAVSVKADFKLEGKKIPKLRYCGVSREDLKTHCGEPYYQFFYAYPVLRGQEFSQFLVSINSKPANDFASPEGYGIKMPALDNVEQWISWMSERYPVTDKFKTDISISYHEPKKVVNGRYQFTYTLRSGALWKGRIGRARIFIHSGGGFKLEDCSIPPDKTEREKGIMYIWNERKDWEPDKDLTCTVIIP